MKENSEIFVLEMMLDGSDWFGDEEVRPLTHGVNPVLVHFPLSLIEFPCATVPFLSNII